MAECYDLEEEEEGEKQEDVNANGSIVIDITKETTVEETINPDADEVNEPIQEQSTTKKRPAPLVETEAVLKMKFICLQNDFNAFRKKQKNDVRERDDLRKKLAEMQEELKESREIRDNYDAMLKNLGLTRERLEESCARLQLIKVHIDVARDRLMKVNQSPNVVEALTNMNITINEHERLRATLCTAKNDVRDLHREIVAPETFNDL